MVSPAVLAQSDVTDASAFASVAEVILDVGFVALIAFTAWLVTRAGRWLISLVVSRVATRALAGKSSRWRVRLPRVADESHGLTELRRRNRIDATATMVSRVASVVVWFAALLLVLHRFDVDVMVAVSSAGFLGLALAIGGQHSVHDYVTGLHVLLEDRFGEGDEIEVVTSDDHRIRGVVTNVGVFATRLESDGSTWHLANHRLIEVCNHSQLGVPATIEIGRPTQIGASDAQIAEATRAAFSEITAGHVIIDDVTPVSEDDRDTRYEVALRTRRGLSGSERDRLTRRTQERIDEIPSND